MSAEVNTTAVVTFRNNMELLLNQHRSLIWPHLMQVDVSGEKCDITDFLGNTGTSTADDRHGDTTYNDTPHDRIWLVKPPEEEWAELVDRADQLAAKISLSSGYMQAAASAIARAKDDAALAGIYGSIISGKAGTTTTAFPSGMTVAVTTGAASGNARMNVDKLRAARKLLAANFNDMQKKRWIVLTAEQSDDLLKEVPATSSDFKEAYGGQVDPDSGRLMKLLGFNIIEMELSNPLLKKSVDLSTDASGFRKNPFWVDGGVVKGAWEELFTGVDVLPQKRHSTQVRATTTVAATRTQSGSVGIILNNEA